MNVEMSQNDALNETIVTEIDPRLTFGNETDLPVAPILEFLLLARRPRPPLLIHPYPHHHPSQPSCLLLQSALWTIYHLIFPANRPCQNLAVTPTGRSYCHLAQNQLKISLLQGSVRLPHRPLRYPRLAQWLSPFLVRQKSPLPIQHPLVHRYRPVQKNEMSFRRRAHQCSLPPDRRRSGQDHSRRRHWNSAFVVMMAPSPRGGWIPFPALLNHSLAPQVLGPGQHPICRLRLLQQLWPNLHFTRNRHQ